MGRRKLEKLQKLAIDKIQDSFVLGNYLLFGPFVRCNKMKKTRHSVILLMHNVLPCFFEFRISPHVGKYINISVCIHGQFESTKLQPYPGDLMYDTMPGNNLVDSHFTNGDAGNGEVGYFRRSHRVECLKTKKEAKLGVEELLDILTIFNNDWSGLVKEKFTCKSLLIPVSAQDVEDSDLKEFFEESSVYDVKTFFYKKNH